MNGRPVDVDRSTRRPISYQLEIMLERPLRLRVGRLGPIELDAGRYVYTGSAKRALESRIARHLRGDKKVHWHIDYLLSAPGVRVVVVHVHQARDHDRVAEVELARPRPSQRSDLLARSDRQDAPVADGHRLRVRPRAVDRVQPPEDEEVGRRHAHASAGSYGAGWTVFDSSRP